MKTLNLALLAAALSAAGGGASAATLSLVGEGYVTRTLNDAYEAATDTTTQEAYDAVDTAKTAQVGSTVSVLTDNLKNSTNGLAVSGPAKVTFTYLGFESVLTNIVTVGGETIFRNLVNSITEENYSNTGDSFSFTVAAGGLLDFIYETLNEDGRGNAGYVSNSGGAYAYAVKGLVGIAFGEFFNNGSSVIVMYDDGGDGPDRDYDDLTFRIDVEDLPIIEEPPVDPEVAPVPLPAAGFLLLGSLGGLSLLGRKRKAVV